MLVVRSVVSGRVGICCSVSRCAAPQQRGSEHLDGGFGPPNRILLAVRLRLQRIIRVYNLCWGYAQPGGVPGDRRGCSPATCPPIAPRCSPAPCRTAAQEFESGT